MNGVSGAPMSMPPNPLGPLIVTPTMVDVAAHWLSAVAGDPDDAARHRGLVDLGAAGPARASDDRLRRALDGAAHEAAEARGAWAAGIAGAAGMPNAAAKRAACWPPPRRPRGPGRTPGCPSRRRRCSAAGTAPPGAAVPATRWSSASGCGSLPLRSLTRRSSRTPTGERNRLAGTGGLGDAWPAMTRVLLVNPPSPEALGTPLLGLQYVAAALLERGCEVARPGRRRAPRRARPRRAAGRAPPRSRPTSSGSGCSRAGCGTPTGWRSASPGGSRCWWPAARTPPCGRCETLERGFDVALVGEAERSIVALVDALEGARALEDVPGAMWRERGGAVRATPALAGRSRTSTRSPRRCGRSTSSTRRGTTRPRRR